MSKVDVDKVCVISKVFGNGFWVIYYEEMVKKIVICWLFKYLLVSIELQIVVILDECVDVGLDQDNVFIFIGEYSVVDDQFQDQVLDGVNIEMGEIIEFVLGQQLDIGDIGDDGFNFE